MKYLIDLRKDGKMYQLDTDTQGHSKQVIIQALQNDGYDVVRIENAKKYHRCKYCGEMTPNSYNDITDDDILCEECTSLFGHRYYSML